MKQKILENTFALLAGVIFSLGLWLADMVNPQRIIGFLDIFGNWDPALMFVMGGALLIAIPGFYLANKKQRSLIGLSLEIPKNKTIDKNLLTGAILFGIGWGLVGLCPGPVIAVLPNFFDQVILFVISMMLGMFAVNKLKIVKR